MGRLTWSSGLHEVLAILIVLYKLCARFSSIIVRALLWQCRGARVHSDSWGTSTPEYDGLAFDVDHFAWVRHGMACS